MDLANRYKVARGALQQIEAGAGNPTIGTLNAICDALGVTLESILLDSPPVPLNPRNLLSAADLSRALQGIVEAGPATQVALMYIATCDPKYFELLAPDARQILSKIRTA
jgi:transcriptional regulator with XRE-family HTH domain